MSVMLCKYIYDTNRRSWMDWSEIIWKDSSVCVYKLKASWSQPQSTPSRYFFLFAGVFSHFSLSHSKHRKKKQKQIESLFISASRFNFSNIFSSLCSCFKLENERMPVPWPCPLQVTCYFYVFCYFYERVCTLSRDEMSESGDYSEYGKTDV